MQTPTGLPRGRALFPPLAISALLKSDLVVVVVSALLGLSGGEKKTKYMYGGHNTFSSSPPPDSAQRYTADGQPEKKGGDMTYASLYCPPLFSFGPVAS